MTITRLGQLTAEQYTRDDIATYGRRMTVASTPRIFTVPYTGTYSYEIGIADAMGVTFTPRNELRAGYWLQFLSAARYTPIFYFHIAGGNLSNSFHIIAYNGNTDVFDIYHQNTVVASTSALVTGFHRRNQWHHFAATFKAGAGGFISFYMDGDLVLTYSGTIVGNIDAVYMNDVQHDLNNSWGTPTYMDDFYVDDTTGEADTSPPTHRFIFNPIEAVGVDNDFTPVGDTTVKTTVDELTPDGDTTFNYTSTSGDRDTFSMTYPTLPLNFKIGAVIPYAFAKKSEPFDVGEITLHDWNGVAYRDSSALELSTVYAAKLARWELQQSGDTWNIGDYVATQFGYRSNT